MKKSPNCVHCGEGMQVIKVDKYNKPHGLALVAVSIVFIIAMPVEALLSIVLIPFGLVVFFAKKEVWHCSSCAVISEKANV